MHGGAIINDNQTVVCINGTNPQSARLSMDAWLDAVAGCLVKPFIYLFVTRGSLREKLPALVFSSDWCKIWAIVLRLCLSSEARIPNALQFGRITDVQDV